MQSLMRLVAPLGLLALFVAAPHVAWAEEPRDPLGVHPEPARLFVDAVEGAAIVIDGVEVGPAPLDRVIPLEPGKHRVVVRATGFEPRVSVVELAPSETRYLSVDLAATDQRMAAWSLFGVGWASLGTGIAFGVLAVVEDRRAGDRLPNEPGRVPTAAQRAAADEILATRDRNRLIAGLTAGLGLALTVVGGVLFAFDDPEPEEGPAPAAAWWPTFGEEGAGVEVRLSF